MKWIYSIIIVLIFTVSVSAQAIGSVTYNVAVPTAKLNNYIDKLSWQGLGMEGRWFTKKDFSFGLSLGWNIFNVKTGEVIQIHDGGINGAVSGTQIRNVNSFPMLATAHYYTGGRRDQIRFYFGTGAGLYYIRQRLEIGFSVLESNNWHFGLTPEAGILFELSRDVMMIFNTKYNYAFSSGTSISGSNDNAIAYLGINIGFVWGHF